MKTHYRRAHRLLVEHLEDRITPSFTSSLQLLIANADQISGLGNTVASGSGLLDNVPVVSQTLDSFTGVVAGYGNIAAALTQVGTSPASAGALQTALNSTGLGSFTVTLRNNSQDQIYISYTKTISSAPLTVASSTDDFTGGKLGYLAQVTASGSGTVSGQAGVNLQVGTDGSQLLVPTGDVAAAMINGSVTVTGSASIAGNAFQVQVSGTARLGANFGVFISGPANQVIPISQVGSSLGFDNNGGISVSLYGQLTASVLGVNLVQWGSPSSDPNAPGNTPLFLWTNSAAPFDHLGQAQINYGTVQYEGNSAKQQAESRLFSFLTKNALGVVGANLNVGGIQVQDLQKVGELVTLLQMIEGDYNDILSGDGSNFTRNGQPASNGDYGFQPDLLPQSSSTQDPNSPFHFQTDPSALLAFAQGQPVDLVWYQYQGTGPTFGEDVPVASYTWRFLYDLFKIDLSGTVGAKLTPSYQLRFGLDTNGLFVDTSQTGVQVTMSSTASLNADVKFLEFAGVADAKLGLDLTAGVSFGLHPTRGTKLYLQDLISSADVSGYTTSNGIPSALNGVSDWLQKQVFMDTQPSRSQLFFTIGLNNPAQSVADAFFNQLPGSVGDDLRAVAAQLGIGEKIQSLTQGLTKAVQQVCSWQPVKEVVNFISKVTGQQEICNTVVQDITATFGGNMIPMVDDMIGAIGITPSGINDVSVGSLSDIPGTYAAHNPTFPADPPDGIWHYSIPGLGLSRAEYTWSWNVNLLPRHQDSIANGNAPAPTDPNSGITYQYDPTTGNLVVTGTSGNDVIAVRPDGHGGAILTKASSTDGGATYTFDPIVQVNGVTSVTINGGTGDDQITVDPSLKVNATVTAGTGHNVIVVGDGNDKVTGNGIIAAGNGTDTVSTTGAVVHTGNGNDSVSATNSIVYTGSGNNTITAGGNDTLHPGTGHTTFLNITASDQFVHAPGQEENFQFFAPGGAALHSAGPGVIGTFDASTGTWYLRGADTGGPPDAGQFAFGASGWVPVVGDWNGDGVFTIGVVDTSTETWYLRNSNSSGAPSYTPFQFGAPGWIPVVGDWTGSGHSGIGVFDPSTGTWYLRTEVGPGGADAGKFAYGAPGWLPVVGDWDGDGTVTVGVVDPATETWYLRNSNTLGAPDIKPFAYGAPGWQPVVGDWNSDGEWTAGVVDPGSGTWYLRNANSGGPPDVRAFAYGAPGWLPLAGDWAAQGTAQSASLADHDRPAQAAKVMTDDWQTSLRQTQALDSVFANVL